MEFKEKVENWMKLIRTDRVEADRFYFEVMFEDVISRFVQKSKILEKYKYLISLLGFSPQPIILFIRAIRPQKVLFIYSDESESYLDMIQKWTDLTFAQILKEQVKSSDPSGVYKAIKEFIVNRNPGEILLDITGGKKAMVGGAAMAGNFLGIDTGYVDYERYLPDLRQPEPGTEYPNILKNPFYVLGDIELEKAKEAFNHLNFNRCLEILNGLNSRVEDIWGVRKLKAVAEIYQHFDTFDFVKALQLIEDNLDRLRDDSKLCGQIERTRGILQILNNPEHTDYNLYTCINYYFAGERFSQRGRYDVAIFLMYRTIEMILSCTLKDLGIDPSKPNYPSWVSHEKYQEKLKEVFQTDYYEKALPNKIGLMDSAILLSINQHPIVRELNLHELKGIITLRNESHFTHGSRRLSQEDFRKIRRHARKLLEKYVELKGKPKINEFENFFLFPNL